MKTNRKQQKFPIGLRLPVFLKKGIKYCRYSFLCRYKKKQVDNKQKFS